MKTTKLRMIPATDADPPRLDAIVGDYLEWLESLGRDRRHLANVRRYLDGAAKATPTPADVTAHSVRRWLMELSAKGLAPKTRNEARSALSGLVDYMVSDGLLPKNPISSVKRAKVIRTQARIVPTIEQVAQLILSTAQRKQQRDRWLVYLVLASTGIRIGTARQLEWQHVRLDGPDYPHLALPGTIQKNGKAAKVWLTQEAASWLAWARQEAQHAQQQARLDGVGMFLSVGKPENFTRDVAKAGLEKHNADGATFSAHSLRHFASNRMAWASAFSDKERAEQNAHETTAMTRTVYTDPSHSGLAKKIWALPNILPDNWFPPNKPTYPQGNSPDLQSRGEDWYDRTPNANPGIQEHTASRCGPRAAAPTRIRSLAPGVGPGRTAALSLKGNESGTPSQQIRATGFEPATSWTQTTRSTKLSYTLRRTHCIPPRSPENKGPSREARAPLTNGRHPAAAAVVD